MRTGFNLRRALSIAAKEWLHIIHDPRSLVIIVLMPVFQLVIFGYAMNMEIQEIRLLLLDMQHGTFSQDLLKTFEGAGLYRITPFSGTPEALHERFGDNDFDAALIIPPDAGRDHALGKPASLQLMIDASDPNKATLIESYTQRILAGMNHKASLPVETGLNILFNPDLESSFFFVPGLVAFILVMICALLTSITITREKESGTLEQLTVTPALPSEIILGKLMPYIGLSLVIAACILVLGIVLFGVVFTGSIGLLTALSLLYIVAALCLGVMISTLVDSQQAAMLMAVMLTMLPTIMLSGFIFPLGSMPLPLQWISRLIPARYYLTIVRGIMLKGNTLSHLTEPVITLAVFTLLTLIVAIRRFRKDIGGAK